jgi:segregation and condensation protein B
MNDLDRILEAILFVSDSPVSTEELAEVTERPKAEVTETLERMGGRLDEARGIELREVAGGWRLYTQADLNPYLERFASTERARKLSGAAVETLAVVAYRQPVSRGQVAEIRGVDSEHALRTLERRELVEEIGRAPGPGQAVLYGTTTLFLEKMGIASIGDLPPLADHVPPAEIMETLEMPMRPESSSNDSTS